MLSFLSLPMTGSFHPLPLSTSISVFINCKKKNSVKIILRAWAWFPWWYKTLYWYRVTIIYENSVADFHAHYLLDLNYQELYSPCLIGHGLISPCNSSIISLWILFFFWFQQYCIKFFQWLKQTIQSNIKLKSIISFKEQLITQQLEEGMVGFQKKYLNEWVLWNSL